MPSTCLWYYMSIRKYSNYKTDLLRPINIWSIRNTWVRIQRWFFVLTSLSYVITVLNLVESGVIRWTFYSQVSYTRRVHMATWMYCWMNTPWIKVRVSNGPISAEDIYLASYLSHVIWSVWESNRGWFQGIVVGSYTNIYAKPSNNLSMHFV